MKAILKSTLLAGLLSAGAIQSQPASGPPAMNAAERSAFFKRFLHPGLHEFKASAEWDRRLLADDRKVVVVRDWSELGQGAASIAGLSVNLQDRSSTAAGAAEGTLLVFNGTFEATTVSLLITQATTLDDAGDFFLFKLSATNRTQLNYVVGPRDLGTVAARFDSKGPAGSLMWVYKNLFFDVRGADFMAVERLSRRIQALAEQSLAPAASRTQPPPPEPIRR